ncbi:MAG: hypothetical protein GWO02_12390, partial [Gammaproteobacteria bacterium]|nr:hypothetical protein [Gammaproteobacteria bacterium]
EWADLKEIIEAKKKTAPYVAHHLFSYAKSMWNWAIAEEGYGLTTSPLDRKKPSKIIG